MKKLDKVGNKYGRLLVTECLGSFKMGNRNRIKYLCRCDCGNNKIVTSDSLGSKVNSCGCLNKESIASVNHSHGEAKKTKEYRAWAKIKERCYSINCEKYKIYGGRGITVCERWLNSYDNFLSDMGRAPSANHSIDRINVNGNYEPSNCKWSTNKEQANNRNSNVLLEHDGISLNMKQWSEKLNVDYKSMFASIKYKGKTIKDFING